MVVSHDAFYRAVDAFVKQKIIPSMNPSMVRGALGAMSAVGAFRNVFSLPLSDLMGYSLLDLMRVLNVLTPEGIDVEMFAKAKSGFFEAQKMFDIKGLHFASGDFDALVEMIRHTA